LIKVGIQEALYSYADLPDGNHLFFVTLSRGCQKVRFRPAFLRDKPCRIE
jgi:hypothetical protein